MEDDGLVKKRSSHPSDSYATYNRYSAQALESRTVHLHRPALKRTPADVPRARRVPPLALDATQRAPVRDPDVHVQPVPPDALDAHLRPAPGLAPGVGAVRARGTVARTRRAERVAVGALEVSAPGRVFRFDVDAAARDGAAEVVGVGLDLDRLKVGRERRRGSTRALRRRRRSVGIVTSLALEKGRRARQVRRR